MLFSAVRRALALAALIAVCAAAWPQPDVTHDIVVISGRYPNTPAPLMTDAQYAAYYTTVIGAHYASATGFTEGGQTRARSLWRFRASSSFGGATTHTFSFPFRDYGPGDQSDLENIITREGLEAVFAFDRANPGVIDFQNVRNFLVMANMPNRGRASPFTPFVTSLGNFVIVGVTVFDEPAGATIFGGEFVRTDAGGARTVDRTKARTASHELGHLLALPDLYNETVDETDNDPRNNAFVGDWCVMDNGPLSHFCGWSRAVKGWCPPQRIAVPARPAPGAVGTFNFRIFPPQRGNNSGGIEVVMIPTDESLRDFSPTLAGFLSALGATQPPSQGFYGYVLEVRAHTGADATVTSVPVAGVATPTSPRQGQSANAQNGVLISLAQPGFTPRHRPFHPLEVMRSPALEPITRAPFLAGETFTDTARGVTVAVTAQNADGSMAVRVTWTVPPRPSLTVRDAWIDSPGNAFGTFFFGGTATGANPPNLSGDRVFVPTTVTWRSGFLGVPYPVFTITPTAHRVQFRVRNSGRIGIASFSGQVYILEPQFIPPVNFSGNFLTALVNLLAALNPLSTVNFNMGNVAIVGGNGNAVLDPGEEANVTVTFAPRLPFMGAILVNSVTSVAVGATGPQQEPVEGMIDNFFVEPFVVLTTTPGSPWEAKTFEFPIKNVDAAQRFITLSVDGLPKTFSQQKAKNFRVTMSPHFASLKKGQSRTFKITVQPPDPPDYKGGIETIGVLGWMNLSDAVIPIDRLDVQLVSTSRSLLTTSMDTKGTVSGRLQFRNLVGATLNAPAGLPIHLHVSGSDGTAINYTPGTAGFAANTASGGTYVQPAKPGFTPKAGARYKVVAEWLGNTDLSPATAEFQLDIPGKQSGPDLTISQASAPGRPALLFLQRARLDRVSLRVTNRGTAAVKESAVRLFWSADAFADDRDEPAGAATVAGLAAGASAVLTMDLRVRPSARARFLLAVCDADGKHAESNELNNVLAIALR